MASTDQRDGGPLLGRAIRALKDKVSDLQRQLGCVPGRRVLRNSGAYRLRVQDEDDGVEGHREVARRMEGHLDVTDQASFAGP